MSAEVVGIVLSLFSLAVAALIYWGGFLEQKRANADAAASVRKV